MAFGGDLWANERLSPETTCIRIGFSRVLASLPGRCAWWPADGKTALLLSRQWLVGVLNDPVIKDQIGVAELPVRHEVWKFGSPYTLVLAKTTSWSGARARRAKTRLPA